ncbi:hypothetical protein [Kutzneria kofuensis]|uniref:hypothetical protein n=1 Tax=Kutzneria kofuensis TaxID=103725 RepID=UPI0031EDC512
MAGVVDAQQLVGLQGAVVDGDGGAGEGAVQRGVGDGGEQCDADEENDGLRAVVASEKCGETEKCGADVGDGQQGPGAAADDGGEVDGLVAVDVLGLGGGDPAVAEPLDDQRDAGGQRDESGEQHGPQQRRGAEQELHNPEDEHRGDQGDAELHGSSAHQQTTEQQGVGPQVHAAVALRPRVDVSHGAPRH